MKNILRLSGFLWKPRISKYKNQATYVCFCDPLPHLIDRYSILCYNKLVKILVKRQLLSNTFKEKD